MNLVLVVGAVSIVGAIAALWWAVTSRPSPARANLFAGLPEPTGDPVRSTTLLGRIGQSTRRILPTPMVDGLEVNLLQAGHPGGLDLPRIIGVKVSLALVTAVTLLVTGRVVVALIAAALMFFLPDYWVLSVRDKRQRALQADVADTIDQLTICVEAGLAFDAALARVATSSDGPLSEELRRTLSDIRAGVPRAQALHSLADRAQIAEVRQLVGALLQSQKHGVSMADTLRVQSAEIRLKRTQRIEEKAAKLAVKLLFPIVFCFLPVFVIITVVPAVLRIGETF